MLLKDSTCTASLGELTNTQYNPRRNTSAVHVTYVVKQQYCTNC